MNILEEIPKTPAKSSSTISIPKVNSSVSTNSTSAFSIPNLSMDFSNMNILWILIIVLFAIGAMFGSEYSNVVYRIKESFLHFVDMLGDLLGITLQKTSDVASNISKNGIDITNGVVQNVGGFLIGNENMYREPRPDISENTIQKPVTSSKTKWCLAGEYQNKRGCVPIDDKDTCTSNQIYATREMCMNPNTTATSIG